MLTAGAGAATGGVFGLGATAIGAAVGAAIPAIRGALGPSLPGFSRGASRNLAAAYEASGPAEVRATLDRLGPDAMLLDAGQPFLGRAQGIAAQPGAPGQRVVAALEGRNDGTNARLATDVNDALGPAPVPSRIVAGIEDAQAALGPDYGQSFAGASAVDTSRLAGRLEAGIVDTRGRAQDAMREVRRMLDVPGSPGTLDPSPRALLSTRQAIDGRMAAETDPNAVRALTMARQEVDAELGRAVPGIKNVDAQFAELARQREALTRGGQVLDSGKTALRPIDLSREIAAGVQLQGAMVGPSAAPVRMREGARAEVDRLVGTSANDLQALKQAVKGEGDWNRDKLALLFGEAEASRVLAATDREAAFRDAFNRVVNGSNTAKIQEGVKATGVRELSPGSADTGIALGGALGGGAGAATAALLKGARYGWNAFGRSMDRARNDQVSRALTAQDTERDALVLALMAHGRDKPTSTNVTPVAAALAQALMQPADRASDNRERAKALAGAVMRYGR